MRCFFVHNKVCEVTKASENKLMERKLHSIRALHQYNDKLRPMVNKRKARGSSE